MTKRIQAKCPPLRLITVIVAAVLPPLLQLSPASADDLFDRAVEMYKTGSYSCAGEALKKVVAKDPKNASAHYLLGNVLFEAKKFDDAAKQYDLAEQLSPQGQIGEYSRLALTNLAAAEQQLKQQQSNPPTAASAQSNQPATSAPSNPAASVQPNPAGDDIDQEAMRRSVRTVSQQTDLSQQQIAAECDAKVKQIQREAEDKITRLNNDMREQIAANGQPIRGRTGWVYDPSASNRVITEEFERRIDAIRSDTSKRVDEVTILYKQRQLSLNESALTIDRNYQGGSHSNVIINPLGTNIYTRNYQTNDEPSGNPVPVKAAPAKLLSGDGAKSLP